ncbi:MAG TPA: DUF1800 domain-containing protein [Burkholderiales bacterium]|nr:DUF1800 domain-containing protein [Burkholderiales bacterium]
MTNGSTLRLSEPRAAGMGRHDARHLLERTGFEAPLGALEACAVLSRPEAVDRILAGVRRDASTPLPASASRWTPPDRIRDMDPEARKAFVRELREHALELKGWWLNEMVVTGSPLTERMTLFWHGHFTSSLQKVRSPMLMARQNALLREHALGNFAQLLHAVSKDPAMLVYLDTAWSRKGRPNENFAREVMELFTLGVGHYGEQDVREAARAYTGWSIDPATGAYKWRAFAHDDGAKTVLGRRGDFDGDQVLDILLAQPACAELIAARLWSAFVSPAPQDGAERDQLGRVTRGLRDSGYEIRPALRALLLTEAFWAPRNRGALVKSPAELVVGTLRQFEVRYSDPLPFVFVLRNLGQDILSPPNVKGWPGGDAWINSQTLLARRQFLARLFRVDESAMMPAAMHERAQARMAQMKPGAQRMLRALLSIQFSARAWLAQFGGAGAAREIDLVLLPLPAASAPPADAQGMDRVRSLVADATYQLK